jgi:hypothetical protein
MHAAKLFVTDAQVAASGSTLLVELVSSFITFGSICERMEVMP